MSTQFMDKAKKLVSDDYNRQNKAGFYLAEEPDTKEVTSPEDFYIVWFSKTLQNWKALISTDVRNDGIYWEVTYNGDKGETYIDRYKKVSNVAVKDED